LTEEIVYDILESFEIKENDIEEILSEIEGDSPSTFILV
jgi:hypothetical protein